MLTYTYRYNRVIDYFKRNPIKGNEHLKVERHHIIPRSCGGSDTSDNLVNLPVRWHYIVHCWLPAVYLEAGDQCGYEKMLFAWNRMQNYRNTFREGLVNIKTESLLYQELKTAYLDLISRKMADCQHGEKNSQYNAHWWKDPNDKTKSMSIKDGDSVPEGWVRGRWFNGDKYASSKSMKGKMIFYNPKTNERRGFKSKEDAPPGWIHGLPPNHFSKKTIDILSNKAKEQHKREFIKRRELIVPEITKMYEVYIKDGFEAVKEKFHYKYSCANLLQTARRYIPHIYRGRKPIE